MVPPEPAQPYPPTPYLTRYEAPGTAPFSQVQVGVASDPYAPDSSSQPYHSMAKALRGRIAARLADPTLLRLGGSYSTQVLDPMFMEPEAGLAWLDRSGAGTLRKVVCCDRGNTEASKRFGG